MIKRYTDFVKGKVNEDFEMEHEVEAPEMDMHETEMDNTEMEESELPEEEGGEYEGQKKMAELAEMLGTEVIDNKIEHDGKTINFFSETESFHVDNKKFKTAEEVVNYLEKSTTPEHTHSHHEVEENEMDNEEEMMNSEEEEEKFESKSYRHTRLKKFGK
jgi:hypothetical protein